MADEPKPVQAQTTPDAGGQGGQPSAEAQAAKFTQEQLDAIIAERLAREKSKYADYDELKKRAQAVEDANKSELERAVERANKAEIRQKEIEQATQARLLTAEARAIAAELGFAKPDKAIKLAELHDAITDGEVDSAKIKTALDALAKDMPELLKQTPQGKAQSVTNPGRSNDPTKSESREIANRALGRSSLPAFFSDGKLVINSDG